MVAKTFRSDERRLLPRASTCRFFARLDVRGLNGGGASSAILFVEAKRVTRGRNQRPLGKDTRSLSETLRCASDVSPSMPDGKDCSLLWLTLRVVRFAHALSDGGRATKRL